MAGFSMISPKDKWFTYAAGWLANSPGATLFLHIWRGGEREKNRQTQRAKLWEMEWRKRKEEKKELRQQSGEVFFHRSIPPPPEKKPTFHCVSVVQMMAPVNH